MWREIKTWLWCTSTVAGGVLVGEWLYRIANRIGWCYDVHERGFQAGECLRGWWLP